MTLPIFPEEFSGSHPLTVVKDNKQSNRLTVVEQIYHQPAHNDAVGFDCHFSRILKTDEQAYKRDRTINDDQWINLTTDWVEKYSQLILYNKEGYFKAGIPTEEERAFVQSKVILVSLRGDGVTDIVIPFKESCRFSPSETCKIQIKAANGPTRFSVVAIPE